VDALF